MTQTPTVGTFDPQAREVRAKSMYGDLLRPRKACFSAGWVEFSPNGWATTRWI